MSGIAPLAILCHQFKYRNTSVRVAGHCRQQEGCSEGETAEAMSGAVKRFVLGREE